MNGALPGSSSPKACTHATDPPVSTRSRSIPATYAPTSGRRTTTSSPDCCIETLCHAHFLTGAPGVDWDPRRFYVQQKLAKPWQTNKQVRDEALIDRFWRATAQLAGVKP
ncbi:hypothetical protein GCM10010524_42610 [Streptomyces mexicanus]